MRDQETLQKLEQIKEFHTRQDKKKIDQRFFNKYNKVNPQKYKTQIHERRQNYFKEQDKNEKKNHQRNKQNNEDYPRRRKAPGNSSGGMVIHNFRKNAI